jgi:hypothetical protein
MKKSVLIGGLAVVLIGVIAFVGLYNKKEQSLGQVNPIDFVTSESAVIGTHTGTTTTGVLLTSATSTKVSKIGRNIDTAIYNIKVTALSTTTGGQYAIFGVECSNDAFCDTSSSTAPDLKTGNINWFSAGDHFRNKVHATSSSNASTTQTFAITDSVVGLGHELILTDLNCECLRLGYSGVSTSVFIGLSTKAAK